MTTWAVIATGESLKPAPELVVAKVKHLPCVAVCNAFAIAPWARDLVATDPDWWKVHPEAKAFAGEKWSCNEVSGVGRIRAPGIFTNTNSGLLGLHQAVVRGATLILLLGVDMKGTHYFGRYTNGRPNTEPERFAFFINQFSDYASRMGGCEVINCNPDSALNVWPKMTLDEALLLEPA